MSKQWVLNRSDLKREPVHNKLHNPTKFAELGAQIEHFVQASQNDKVNRLCRKLIEETANIVQHNTSWNELKIRTEFNQNKTTFKIHIIYDGGEYRDPVNSPHIMDTGSRFASYIREIEIEQDGTVNIRIYIGI